MYLQEQMPQGNLHGIHIPTKPNPKAYVNLLYVYWCHMPRMYEMFILCVMVCCMSSAMNYILCNLYCMLGTAISLWVLLTLHIVCWVLPHTL